MKIIPLINLVLLACQTLRKNQEFSATEDRLSVDNLIETSMIQYLGANKTQTLNTFSN